MEVDTMYTISNMLDLTRDQEMVPPDVLQCQTLDDI